MNKPVKLPEIRKEAFIKARESLGLSTKDLSGMSCFSVRQIEQLENGESSSFYGAQVKVTAAKRIAELLKLSEEEAFDFGVSTPIPKAASLENNAQEEKTEVVKETWAAASTKIAEPKSENIKAHKIEPSTINYSVQSKAQVSSKKKTFFLLAIAAAVIFSIVNLRPLFFPEPVKEEIVVVQEAAQEPAPAPELAADAKPASTLAPAAALPEAAPAQATECPPADTSALNYKPDAPKKAGGMVYLQSTTAQTVCVVDAAGKTQNKVLEPGVGISVYGKPPLKVLTGGLNQVDLYYQGAKVRIGNTSNKTIILEPAEIIQPVTPTNSTDSQLR